ncbi:MULTISPECIES: hypothetical protein [Gordonia]|uniref:hypothetical protein n=1 Tax=Gordonia TaxID=2053 RepID=UPI0012FAEBED|nr:MULTISPECIES: hypothetical protein [Gordonia]
MSEVSWCWYSPGLVEAPGGGWVSTMPLDCHGCGLRWSDLGLQIVRGNVVRSWGAPPGYPSATVFYECLGCGHRTYCRS